MIALITQWITKIQIFMFSYADGAISSSSKKMSNKCLTYFNFGKQFIVIKTATYLDKYLFLDRSGWVMEVYDRNYLGKYWLNYNMLLWNRLWLPSDCHYLLNPVGGQTLRIIRRT
jgi:hypothetical protein